MDGLIQEHAKIVIEYLQQPECQVFATLERSEKFREACVGLYQICTGVWTKMNKVKKIIPRLAPVYREAMKKALAVPDRKEKKSKTYLQIRAKNENTELTKT